MPGSPLTTWTPGALLQNFRQIQFGTYLFPLTFQEVSRGVKQMYDRRKLSMNFGEWIDPHLKIGAREIELTGMVGSLVYGANGNQLLTDIDLENERTFLAGLQVLGKQPLYSRPDRYCWATLTEFTHKFMQDGGAFRWATWDLKLIADDPRYYSTNVNSFTIGPFTDTATHSHAISHLGSVKAFPTITITGACTGPVIQISSAAKAIAITFSTLTMHAGDTLVVKCDPRPEYRNVCAVYTPSGGAGTNALQYINPSTGFSNTWDARYFFPFIETNTYGGFASQNFTVQSTSGSPNYTCQVQYNDTWL